MKDKNKHAHQLYKKRLTCLYTLSTGQKGGHKTFFRFKCDTNTKNGKKVQSNTITCIMCEIMINMCHDSVMINWQLKKQCHLMRSNIHISPRYTNAIQTLNPQ